MMWVNEVCYSVLDARQSCHKFIYLSFTAELMAQYIDYILKIK
jgi:hypothetical protein